MARQPHDASPRRSDSDGTDSESTPRARARRDAGESAPPSGEQLVLQRASGRAPVVDGEAPAAETRTAAAIVDAIGNGDSRASLCPESAEAE